MKFKVHDRLRDEHFVMDIFERPLGVDYDFGKKVKRWYWNGERVSKEDFIDAVNLNWDACLFNPNCVPSGFSACSEFYDNCMHQEGEFTKWFSAEELKNG